MRLSKIHEEYGDRAAFFLVYIREAHPIDGWYLGKGVSGAAMKLAGLKAAQDVMDPKTIEERRTVAQRCGVELAHGIPTLVDDLQDSVNTAYAAWPTRLYLIGQDGRVLYAGGPGPFGFKPTALRFALEAHFSDGTNRSL